MQRILTISPNNKARVYKSYSSASRVLSGTGSINLRHTIAKQVNSGGGWVGDTYVVPFSIKI
jgi:hypothetical protein